jgi:Fe-S cluster biogenesis protein NfuA
LAWIVKAHSEGKRIMPGDTELQQQLASIEDLLSKVESTADPSLRASVRELVELVMNLHGAGLSRMLEFARAAGEPGEALAQKMGRDELVGSLLVLHGQHPLSLEARAAEALDRARVRLRPHGGEVELLSIEDGAIHLRLQSKGEGCGSTAQSMKEIVEAAVYQAAPDLTSLIIEGAEEKQGFVPLEMLLTSRPASFALNGKGGL